MPVYRLKNPVQHYDWGTIDAIPRLLGIENPSRRPFAELWMGAHPKAPSTARTREGDIPLSDLIAYSPETALGPPIRRRFGSSLPFLFKVLSAALPLSIQAHPSRQKAEKGFERENLASIPLDAPERNYRDPNHKPEMVVALQEFEGLCGFRPMDQIVRLVRAALPREYRSIVGPLERNPGKVELSVLFYRFITFSENKKRDILYYTERRIKRALEVEKDMEIRRVLGWVLTLMAIYPGDIGALAPFILNLFRLEPGQALYIRPGQIHAYFKGTVLEIMANSDNVLRGALTSKHVDVPELLSVLSFDPESLSPFEAVPVDDSVREYPSRAEDFRLDRILLAGGRSAGRRLPGPEILLCLDGSVEVSDETEIETARPLRLGKGGCAFVPAGSERYALRGEGLVYRAGVTV